MTYYCWKNGSACCRNHIILNNLYIEWETHKISVQRSQLTKRWKVEWQITQRDFTIFCPESPILLLVGVVNDDFLQNFKLCFFYCIITREIFIKHNSTAAAIVVIAFFSRERWIRQFRCSFHPNWMTQCGNLSFYLLKNQLIDDFVSGAVHKRPEDFCGRAASEKKIDLERRSSAAFFVGHEAAPRLLYGFVKKAPLHRYRRGESTALE